MNHRLEIALALLIAAGCAAVEREKGAGAMTPLGPAGLSEVRPKRFALVVGVEAYEDERFPPLKYPARDAEAVAAALGGFEKVTLLATAELTSRARILAALEQLARDASDPRSTVLIYLSGHGSLAQQPGGALERVLVTRDTRLDLLAQTGLRVDELLAFVDRIPSRRKAVVLALCHSGRGKSQLDDALSRALATRKAAPVIPLEQRSEATFVLTACAFGETARESDVLGHDIYTHFLLAALEEGDRDGDGAVSASEAHDFARERTYEFTQGAQRPTSESQLLGKDPVLLRGEPARPGRPVVYSYAPSAEGVRVTLDGRDKGTLPGGIAADPGSHQLRLTDATSGKVLYEGKVSLREGEHVELSQLVPRPLELGVAIAALTWLPLNSTTRSDFAPASFGLGARVAVSGILTRGWLEAGFSWSRGSSAAQSFNSALPFSFESFRGELAGGARFVPREPLALDAGLVVGVLRLSREFNVPNYVSSESAWGGSAAVRIRARVSLLTHLYLALGADLGVFAASLGAQSFHPFAGAWVEAGATY